MAPRGRGPGPRGSVQGPPAGQGRPLLPSPRRPACSTGRPAPELGSGPCCPPPLGPAHRGMSWLYPGPRRRAGQAAFPTARPGPLSLLLPTMPPSAGAPATSFPAPAPWSACCRCAGAPSCRCLHGRPELGRPPRAFAHAVPLRGHFPCLTGLQVSVVEAPPSSGLWGVLQSPPPLVLALGNLFPGLLSRCSSCWPEPTRMSTP